MTQYKHRGFFGVDAAIMIGFAVLGIVALMAMHAGIIQTIVPQLHDRINYMPTFYTYENGTRVDPNEPLQSPTSRRNSIHSIDTQINNIRLEILDLENEKNEAIKIDDIDSYNKIDEQIKQKNKKLSELGYEPIPNINLKLYWMFGFYANLFFAGGLVFSVAVLGLERVNLGVKRGTAIKIFKGSVISLVVIYTVPEIWDPIAIEINKIGLYMLDPFYGEPQDTTQKLFCRMGGCVGDARNLLDEDVHKMLAADPDFGQDFFVDIFLGVFRLTSASMMSLMFFITATIRITFTLIILITLPLWLVFRYIPPLKKLSQTVISSFIGACLAPPLVSTVLFVGEQYMIGNPGEAMTEWITVLGIATLAQTFLLILAPILQSTISQATSNISTGIQSTTMATTSVGSAAGKSVLNDFRNRDR